MTRKEAWLELAKRAENGHMTWGLCSEIRDMKEKGLITGWRAFWMLRAIDRLSRRMRSAFVWPNDARGNKCRQVWCRRQAFRDEGFFPHTQGTSEKWREQ